ncbi:MAG: outer membrane protein assembly factor BamB family protein [Gemmataceae bacterium]
MRKWSGLAGLILGLALLLEANSAQALITALTPLQHLLDDSTFIVAAKVESVDGDRPSMVLVVDEDLKGKAPPRKLAVLLKGDAEAKKKNQVPEILKRIAPKLSLVLFIIQKDTKYMALAYSNGTWFQIVGVESDGVVRWSFTHGEPYLRKTFKGSTEELKQSVVEVLAGKKEPPKPDAKEKPGFGPEAPAEKKSPPARGGDKGGAPASGTMFAVIPTVLVGGPLAILAMFFPAVFGGLMLVLRRWMAALSVLSVNSTLYLLQELCRRWLVGSWWGTSPALWLTMAAVTLLGILWAWRKHHTAIQEQSAEPVRSPGAGITTELVPALAVDPKSGTGWGEIIALGILTLLCLATELLSLPRSLAQLDLWDKTLLMFSAGLGMATLHALYRRWAFVRTGTHKPGLPGEGVLLWTMLLVSIAFSTTWMSEAAIFGEPAASAAGWGARDNWQHPAADAAGSPGGWRQGVLWRFQPKVERCWMASSPRVDGERVYIGVVLPSVFGPSGAIYCVDRKTGKEIWMFNDAGDMKNVFSSPCVADGRLYVGEGFHQHADCKLYCLDAATGKKIWDFATASHTESTPCVSGGKVYFGAGDDGLYCLDAESGKEKWHVKGLHVDVNPLVIDNRLYGGSGVGDNYQDKMLFCLHADTGAVIWRMPMDLPVWGMPVVRGEYLYAGIGNGNFLVSADQLEKPEKPAGAMLCLERATGKRIWRYNVGDGVHMRACVDDEHVWFAARDRHCYCLDRQTGTRRWKTDLGSPVVASPALAGRGEGKALYVASSAGLVSRLDPHTGKIDWTFDVSTDAGQSATVFSSPLVQVHESRRGESRSIWFGCGLKENTRGILYCLEERTVE